MKSLKYIFAVAFIIFGMASCKYSFIVPEEIPDVDTIQISFAEDIQPIFDGKCASCHGGSLSPNLTSGNSYSAISSNYINATNPEESLIYTKADPNTGGTHKKYSQAEAVFVLGWIKQGAKNN